jgi:hypothetical protein
MILYMTLNTKTYHKSIDNYTTLCHMTIRWYTEMERDYLI